MLGLLIISIFIFVLALVCEFVDSHLGGGYGTILTPLFLALGYPPLLIVCSILFSEIITGILGGILYHSFKEVDLKSAGLLGVTAGIGSILGAFLGLQIPKFFLSFYIGILIIILGILMVKNVRTNYKRKKAGIIGGIIGFNKALTGGGFGPVAVAGLSLSGMKSKMSVGTTLLAEGITCIIALTLYYVLGGISLDLPFLIPLVIGAIIGAILGSRRTKKVKLKNHRRNVGIFIFFLGIATLIKLFIR